MKKKRIFIAVCWVFIIILGFTCIKLLHDIRSEDMAYSKTTWANGTTPAINADNLNKIEQGVADAHSNLNNEDDVLNDLHNLINYDYYEPCDHAETSGRMGVKRDNEKIIINKSSTYGYNVYARITGSVVYAFSGADIRSWSNGISLEAGHEYCITLSYVRGTYSLGLGAALPTVRVYEVGSSTNVAASTYDGNKVLNKFVAEQSKAYNFAVTILNNETTYTDTEFVITLEDITNKIYINKLNDKVNDISDVINVLDNHDIIWNKENRVNKTVSGVTFEWNDEKTECTINGSAGDSTDTYIVLNGASRAMPEGMEAGCRYRVTATATSNPNVFLAAYLYTGEGVFSSVQYFRSEGVLIIPPTITGVRIIVGVRAGYTASNDKVSNMSIYKINGSSIYGKDYGKQIFNLEDVESNNVIFDWDVDKRICQVIGTANVGAVFDVLYNGGLPDGMDIGDRFLLRYKLSKNVDIRAVVYFYDKSDQQLAMYRTYMHVVGNNSYDIPIIVPENAAKLLIRLFVPYFSENPVVTNVTIERLQLFKTMPRQMDVPLIISFVDDDATNDTFVTRYHDACCHNGIKGNYAVLTCNLDEESTSVSKMLEYEDEGFGMLIHAYEQTSGGHYTPYWSPVDEHGNRRPHTEAELTQCRANLNRGLREMAEYGFTNFRYWVTPGGNYQDEIIEMAKGMGFKCLISTNNVRYNSLQDCERYLIKRISLRNTRDGDTSLADMKAEIDRMVADGGGWLIITTHFNDGWENTDTWDSTLDDNGYPIGYAKFNEAVQYALSAGLTPMNVPQAWEYYEPIVKANSNDYRRNDY